jgi:branched-chain amino acid transport system substrate-binding protein
MPAQAQELKIGFLAPRTGIITQLGTDMVNGFQMYLDEHNGMLGGAKVTFIVEDDKGTVDGDVSMAKKLILQDKVDMLVGAVLGTAAYALAPISTQEKTLFIGTITTGDDIAQRQSDKFPYTVFSTWVSSQPTHALGQFKAISASPRSAPITPSGTSRLADSRRPSRIAAARSCRNSGCLSAPRTSGRTFRASNPTSTRSSR